VQENDVLPYPASKARLGKGVYVMGPDRLMGVVILSIMAYVGLIVVIAGAFSGDAALGFFLMSTVGSIFYMALVATVLDTDPFKWTGRQLGKLFDKLTNS
jgi:hypothetical protein